MKIIFTCLFLISTQLFAQTYLNVFYSDGMPTNSTELPSIGKITITGSEMNFVLTNNSTVSKDLSTINKITFGSVALGTSLPVELTSFTANVTGRTINLKWTTATENNTRNFEVQRTVSSNAVNNNWITVGIIDAHHNSSTPKEYSFTDKDQEAGKYNYRLKITDNDGSYKLSNVINVEITLPARFELMQNYPNPFNPSTIISYNLPFDCNVKMAVYDVTGRMVEEVVNENQQAGYHDYNFNARSLSSGVYFYSITAVGNNGVSNFRAVKKLILIK